MDKAINAAGGVDLSGRAAAADAAAAADSALVDGSLLEQFDHIQGAAIPHELDALLHKLRARLYDLTEHKQVLQLPELDAGARSRLLLQLSFTRSLAACWAVPLLDALLRVKLNLVGKHMWMEESFAKFSPQPQLMAGHMPAVPLPPRLTPLALEAFLACDRLLEGGVAWVVEGMLEAAGRVLAEVAPDADVSQRDLARLTRRVMDAWLAAAIGLPGGNGGPGSCALAASDAVRGVRPASSPQRPPFRWSRLLLGDEACIPASLRRALSNGTHEFQATMPSTQMVDELNQELRGMLDSYKFDAAVRAAAQHTYCIVLAQLKDSFHSVPAAKATAAAPPVAAAAEGDFPGNQASTSGAAAAGTPAAASEDKRKLVLCSRVLQKACDPVFEQMPAVTRAISALQPVQSLCSTAFAAGPPMNI